MTIYVSRRTPSGIYLDAELALPDSKYEIEDTLQRVQSDGTHDYSIELDECELKFDIPENACLDELNYFAARLERLADYDRDYLQSQVYFEEMPPDMKRMINMTFNDEHLEAYFAGDFQIVGEAYLECEFFSETRNLPDEVI